jgi:hypothetical protein
MGIASLSDGHPLDEAAVIGAIVALIATCFIPGLIGFMLTNETLDKVAGIGAGVTCSGFAIYIAVTRGGDTLLVATLIGLGVASAYLGITWLRGSPTPLRMALIGVGVTLIGIALVTAVTRRGLTLAVAILIFLGPVLTHNRIRELQSLTRPTQDPDIDSNP